MSDQDERSNVRRLGRKDRKRRIDPRGPLFPPEEEKAAVSSSGDQPELKARFAPPSAPEEPAPVITPQHERYPSLNMGVEAIDAARPTPAPIRNRSTCLPNLVALLFLLGTIGMIGMYAVITLNPYTPLNPFPPFTPVPLIITATFLPGTPTPLPTAGPTVTFTPIPVEALGTPQASFPFMLVNDAPMYAPNGNDQGCNWSSIAGTVTDTNGTALNGYGVHITGEGIDSTVFSGAALTFGEGGFELFLNGAPQEKNYSVQLTSPDGTAVSDVFGVTTQANCDQNVAILAFKQSGV